MSDMHYLPDPGKGTKSKIQKTPETIAYCKEHNLDEIAEHFGVARTTACSRMIELDMEYKRKIPGKRPAPPRTKPVSRPMVEYARMQWR